MLGKKWKFIKRQTFKRHLWKILWIYENFSDYDKENNWLIVSSIIYWILNLEFSSNQDINEFIDKIKYKKLSENIKNN